MPFKQQTYVATAFKHVKCSDCNAPDPTWASVNRGVLLCGDCCQIHRTLGRHISEIASLQHGNWAPPRLQMLHNLVQNGANNIWEHELYNTSSKSSSYPPKPSPSDKLRPTKESFIMAKYKDGRFCQKMDEVNVDSLNNQLLLSVTQSSAETTLRLLVMGADVNCSNGDQNTPLHQASAHDQLLQYELLSIYGANPNRINKDNHTPYDVARKCGFYQTANRILSLQYELTDRLIFFINSKQPDHINGQHIIIPEIERRGPTVIEAQNKLKMLDNQAFEELAADIFDEVDRREVEQVWKAGKNNNGLDVRFLPTNPTFSSLRNQGRQKLGTLSAKDFAILIAHILEEGKRREQISRPATNVSYGSYDDEPSYCEVPSEYSDNEPVYDEGLLQDTEEAEGHSSPVYDQVPERDEYIDNKTMMLAKVDSQQRVITHMKDQNNQLQLRINNLEQRNSFLENQNRELMSRLQTVLSQNKGAYDYDLPHSSGGSVSSINDTVPPHPPPPMRSSIPPRTNTTNNRPSYTNDYSNISREDPKKAPPQPRHQTLPHMDTVSEKTQHITSAVTLLRDAIRNDNLHQLPEVYQRILAASQGVASVFPENPQWQTIKLSLELLKRSATELSQLSLAGCNGDRKIFIDSHVNLAKDIARATKSLVGYVQNAMTMK